MNIEKFSSFDQLLRCSISFTFPRKFKESFKSEENLYKDYINLHQNYIKMSQLKKIHL